MFKKTILSTLLAAAGVSAFAADYYVVAPLPGKQHLLDGISVALNSTSLPTGVVGVPYAGFDLGQALQVTGDPGYSATNVGWSVVAGALPAGLTLAKGAISGTPAAAGDQAFTVRATYKTKTGEQAYKILTFAVTVALATGSLPQGVVGVAYPTYDLKPLLTVSGDAAYTSANITWGVVSSTLPVGLTLKSDGTISGTPTTSGTGILVARANYKGINGEQTYQVVTLGITVSLASATLPQGVVGVAYAGYDLNQHLTVSGDAAYNISGVSWSLVSGALPSGLTLGPDGAISGTPNSASSGPVTVRAAYKGLRGEQVYQVVSLSLTVALGTAALPAGVAGAAYGGYDLKSLLTVAGDPVYDSANVSWAMAGGALIAGVSLGGNGVLTGTPTEGATKSFTVEATYKGKKATQSYSLSTTVGLAAVANYRTWSDGTLAANCNAYKNPSLPRTYSGATGSGVYRIQPAGQVAANAYCDMTTNGGGYTVVLVAYDTRAGGAAWLEATDGAPPVPGQANSSYLPSGVGIALANASSEIRIQEVGTSKAIWSSNGTVMANLRAGRVANFSDTLVTDTTAYWQQSYAGLAQLTTTCAANANLPYPNIYWACGNVKGFHFMNASLAAWVHDTPNGALMASYR